jgi:hypothetical protein
MPWVDYSTGRQIRLISPDSHLNGFDIAAIKPQHEVEILSIGCGIGGEIVHLCPSQKTILAR